MSQVTELQGGRRLRGLSPWQNDDLPKVSIITVVLNGEKHLESCIESVLQQRSDYPNIEYLVLDGRSKDQSVAIIKKFADQLDYWHSESDSGIYDAWNKGLALATGDWIAYLNADDMYVSGAIKSYVDKIVAYQKQGVAVEYISSKIEFLEGENRRLMGQPWTWPKFQRLMTVMHVGSIHSRRLFDRFGSFDSAYRICGDYELLLRARDSLHAGFLDSVTVIMRAGGVSNRSMRAMDEAFLAKSTSGGRNKFLSYVEMLIAKLKFIVRRRFCH